MISLWRVSKSASLLSKLQANYRSVHRMLDPSCVYTFSCFSNSSVRLFVSYNTDIQFFLCNFSLNLTGHLKIWLLLVGFVSVHSALYVEKRANLIVIFRLVTQLHFPSAPSKSNNPTSSYTYEANLYWVSLPNHN